MVSRVAFSFRPFNVMISCLIIAAFLFSPGLSLFAEDKAESQGSALKVDPQTAPEETSVTPVEAAAPATTAPEKSDNDKDKAVPPAPANDASNPKYQPKVVIGMLGQEFNIKVLYDHPMDYAGNNFIESIQMETVKGDFLGLATFGPNSKEAYTEFMVNPKLADFDEVMLIAKSSKLGEIKTPLKLELTEQTELTRPALKQEPKSAGIREGKKASSPAKKAKGGKKFLLF